MSTAPKIRARGASSPATAPSKPLGGKAAKLARTAGKVADESMGVRKSGGAKAPAREVPAYLVGVRPAENVREIPLGLIERDPLQPRTEFDEDDIGRTADTMKEHGQLQPARVVLDKARGRYRLVMGERRWRAAMKAGLETLTCIIVDDPAKADIEVQQIVENCARVDLAPLDLARSLKRLIDRPGWTQRHVAKVTGLSTSMVARSLALLDLPGEVKSLVKAGSLAPSTAYELSKLDDADSQRELAQQAATGLPHVAVVELVKKRREPAPAPDPVPALPPVPAAPKSSPSPSALQVATAAPASPDLPTARYPAADLGITPAMIEGANSCDTISGKNPKIRKVLRVGQVSYACVGTVCMGARVVSATLCPISPVKAWEGPIFTDGRGWSRTHGYFGILASAGGAKWVLGHRDTQVTIDFPAPAPAAAPAPPTSPATAAADATPGVHWEEHTGPATKAGEASWVDISASFPADHFSVAVELDEGCEVSVIEALARALRAAKRRYGAGAKFPPGTRVQVVSEGGFEKALVGATGTVEDITGHDNPESVWVRIDWKGGHRHLPFNAASLQALDAGKGGTH